MRPNCRAGEFPVLQMPLTEDNNMADTPMMTLEQFQQFQKFQELSEQMKEAQSDNTPYLAVTNDDDITVIGDPNETEVKPADYTVYFLFPDTKKWRERAKRTEAVETDEINGNPIKGAIPKGMFLAKRTYNDVYITPRRVGSIVTTFALVEQFFYDVTEDGEIREFTYEESMMLFQSIDRELLDATYDVVATVLRIPDDEKDMMLPITTIENATKMVIQNPDIVNSADLFFGLSPSEK